jgi:hypothetical protein
MPILWPNRIDCENHVNKPLEHGRDSFYSPANRRGFARILGFGNLGPKQRLGEIVAGRGRLAQR